MKRGNDEIVFDNLIDVATGKPAKIEKKNALSGISTKRLRDKYPQPEKWSARAQDATPLLNLMNL